MNRVVSPGTWRGMGSGAQNVWEATVRSVGQGSSSAGAFFYLQNSF